MWGTASQELTRPSSAARSWNSGRQTFTTSSARNCEEHAAALGAAPCCWNPHRHAQARSKAPHGTLCGLPWPTMHMSHGGQGQVTGTTALPPSGPIAHQLAASQGSRQSLYVDAVGKGLCIFCCAVHVVHHQAGCTSMPACLFIPALPHAGAAVGSAALHATLLWQARPSSLPS